MAEPSLAEKSEGEEQQKATNIRKSKLRMPVRARPKALTANEPAIPATSTAIHA